MLGFSFSSVQRNLPKARFDCEAPFKNIPRDGHAFDKT